MELTEVFSALIALAAALISAFLLPWLREKCGAARLERVLAVARQVVSAARELDVTGELAALGTGKAEYAWGETKRRLAARGISVDDGELRDAIKAAVTELRIALGETE